MSATNTQKKHRPRSLNNKNQDLVAGDIIIDVDDLKAALNPEGDDAGFICAELVFHAWEIAGAPLINKPAHLLAPTMLFKTRRLAMLGRLV